MYTFDIFWQRHDKRSMHKKKANKVFLMCNIL